MIGKFLIYIAFALSVGATSAYLFSFWKKNDKGAKTGRWAYYGLTAVLLAVSMVFLSLILSHQFQYTYIWQYSSTELPLHYLIASFFSGQEGSFLLWALMLAVVGFFLLPYAKKNGYESLVMGIYSLILVFLMFILIVKSPFNYVWESFAGEGIAAGFKPENGRGLNPILQNYWITIHPPILFAGYAAITAPFVFALAGLIKKDFGGWVRITLPWTLAATAILGFGIMLGGFWAYETLGWGGFWAWDPVENSSLIPWLVAVALVHTMLVHRKTGGLIKTNFFLALMAFILVLYATFLTRSGILGETSVHSFVDPGQLVYTVLLIFQLLFLALGLFVMLYRIKDMPKGKSNFNLTSREFVLSLGSITILIIGFIVLIGTSYPIFAELIGQPKAAIDIKFYNEWNLPIVILMLLLIAASVYLSWKQSDLAQTFKKSIAAIAVSIVATVIVYFAGVKEFQYILLVFTAFLALSINLTIIARKTLKNPRSIGAFVSHAGVALLMLGTIASGVYSKSEFVTLASGESKQVLGHKITYNGKQAIETEYKDREKYSMIVSIEKDGSKDLVYPIIYWSDFNQRQAPFFEPGINRLLTKDIYISPSGIETRTGAENLALSKNQETPIPGVQDLKITLNGFDMSHGMEQQSPESKGVKLGIFVKYTKADWAAEDTLFTTLDMATGQSDPVWKELPGTDKEIAFMYLMVNQESMGASQAMIYVKEKGAALPEPKEYLTFEASTKPFINLAWIGTIALVAGFFVAMAKYRNIKNEEFPAAAKKSKKREVEVA